MDPTLPIPPRPGQGKATRRWLSGGARADDGRSHQPWLPDAAPLKVPDDFSRQSVTLELEPVAIALALAALVLALGRSAEMLDAAYGLDTFPGSETLIALAEAWHHAVDGWGIPAALQALRGLLGVAAE